MIKAVFSHVAGRGAAALVAACALVVAAGAQPHDPESLVEATTVERGPVAADDPQASVDGEVPDTTDEFEGVEVPSEAYLNRLETQLEFVELVEQEKYEQALPLAEKIVALAEAEFGRPSAQLATALNNVAVIQRNLKHYDESKALYLDAIEMYREIEGPFTESIITPLVALGANYHDTGDYTQALGIFQEARTVNRRSFGLLNPDQIEIVYHIASTLSSMRRYEEALEQHQDALRLMERVHGSDTLEIVPYIYRYADWLASAYQFDPARFQYVRAMDIIRNIEGPESATLIEPLREIGNTYRAQKLAEGRGISSLKRALEIAENAEPFDPLVTARVLRDIGDWYTAFSRVNSTGEEYKRAWQLLGELDNAAQIRARWFDDPDYVLREFPSSRGLVEANDVGAVEGFVRIVFDVDEAGDPLNVMVLESEPPGFKDETMLRAIRRSRFRPRLVDGNVVYSSGLIRTFTFYYDPEE